MSDTGRWRRRHWRQDPRCAWCGRVTVLVTPRRHEAPPPNMATVDHLRDRYDPTRGEPLRGRPEVRRVLACLECNHGRAERKTAALPIEELHRRSGHEHLDTEEVVNG